MSDKEPITKTTKVMRIVLIVLLSAVVGFGVLSTLSSTKSKQPVYNQDSDF